MGQQVRVESGTDGIRIIACTGEFEYGALGPLRTAAEAAAADPEVRRIVLDVRGVTFADSSMLALMLFMLRTGRLVLAGPLPPQLDRRLSLTMMRDLFTVTDGSTAVRALRAVGGS
ncbi:STAS domain-containing protein [Streptomyces sp. NPDC002044]|uniref:STAS domain-containing protein n=1 Tax=Streptomyces sp. NPDC002044 TaxID=3154662 RepID=UPI0033274E1D